MNKTDPASSAEVQKSSAAVSTVIPTIIVTKSVRFIRHRDCYGYSVVEAVVILGSQSPRYPCIGLKMKIVRNGPVSKQVRGFVGVSPQGLTSCGAIVLMLLAQRTIRFSEAFLAVTDA